MIKLIPDDSLLDQIWDHWESNELTVNELLSIIPNVSDNKTISEIWHLISVIALQHTKKYAINSLKNNCDEPWIHDNIIFGSGFINFDFNKRVKNSVIPFYTNYLKQFPESLISKRILIESYIDMMLLDKAEIEIKFCRDKFKENSLLFNIYHCRVLYLKGHREEAINKLNCIVSNSNSYKILLMIADTFTQMGMFKHAYEIYEKANISQTTGNRKTDALLAQINILIIIEQTDFIQKHIDDILEIYKTDYGIINSEEINEIKNLQLTTASS